MVTRKVTVEIGRFICFLTIELSGRARCLGRGQARPTLTHGPLERIVRFHFATLIAVKRPLNCSTA
jgi:hypothetical protein